MPKLPMTPPSSQGFMDWFEPLNTDFFGWHLLGLSTQSQTSQETTAGMDASNTSEDWVQVS